MQCSSDHYPWVILLEPQGDANAVAMFMVVLVHAASSFYVLHDCIFFNDLFAKHDANFSFCFPSSLTPQNILTCYNRTMSEESKTPDADYVHMGDGAGVRPGGAAAIPGLDDPNLSQEDRDMRLALALQQQENAAAYDQHKKKHDAAKNAQKHRTAYSSNYDKLAATRKKDHGMLRVPAAYSTENAYVSGEGGEYSAPAGSAVDLKGASPQVIADHKMAAELQKVEQSAVGTGQAIEKMVTEEKVVEKDQNLRTLQGKFTL